MLVVVVAPLIVVKRVFPALFLLGSVVSISVVGIVVDGQALE